MGSFARSWHLTKETWKVLMSDKELLLFPLFSAILVTIAVAVLFAIFAAIGFLVPGAWQFVQQAEQQDGGMATLIGVVIAFVFYLVTGVIVTYFTSGLVGAALMRLRGENPSFGDGLRIARQHLGAIFGYAVIAATVGVVLSLIRGRGGNRSAVGDVAASVGQMAWNITTFLAIPVLVSQKIGPIQALGESAKLLKKSWGEQLVGSTGIGLVFGTLIFLVILGGTLLTVLMASSEQTLAALIVLVLAVLLVVLLATIQAALNGIYKAAVYLYAAEGKEAVHFDPALVQGAFRTAGASA
jgi:hypothetical protein